MNEYTAAENGNERDVPEQDTIPEMPERAGNAEAQPCCSGRKKHRQPDELNALLNRLRRIEGQVRGVQNMLAEDAYCTDILTQISAIQSALNSFSGELLERHIRTCVVNEIRQGDDEVVSDLVRTIRRLMK